MESLKTDGFHKMFKLSSVEYPDGSASGIIYLNEILIDLTFPILFFALKVQKKKN